MRRAYVVVGILVLTASCSGKPNDLRHYATQDPVATTTSTAAPSATSHPTTPTTTTNNAAQLANQVTAGLMIDSSVAEIGFHPSVPQKSTLLSTLPACSAPLTKPAAAAAGGQTGWVGNSSVTTLTEYVAVYPATTAAQVLAATKAALTCSQATKYTLAKAPAGVDASYSWCEKGSQPSCTLLLAKGHLFARAQVITTSEAKAQNLLRDIATPAAARLVAAPTD
ncbi:hypothetical protein [Kutzneria kofuensis]|uniref:PknH-like protein n=1 Tax=Kutzneria kofuensis TaxID=103725 RepID=A0A7W9KNA3_9PSEU|nr:hypothetical protein [Kutzneria kofuensis]MBB5895708.1 hypothetical protein [Kutzneria kofuensis]